MARGQSKGSRLLATGLLLTTMAGCARPIEPLKISVPLGPDQSWQDWGSSVSKAVAAAPEKASIRAGRVACSSAYGKHLGDWYMELIVPAEQGSTMVRVVGSGDHGQVTKSDIEGLVEGIPVLSFWAALDQLPEDACPATGRELNAHPAVPRTQYRAGGAYVLHVRQAGSWVTLMGSDLYQAQKGDWVVMASHRGQLVSVWVWPALGSLLE